MLINQHITMNRCLFVSYSRTETRSFLSFRSLQLLSIGRSRSLSRHVQVNPCIVLFSIQSIVLIEPKPISSASWVSSGALESLEIRSTISMMMHGHSHLANVKAALLKQFFLKPFAASRMIVSFS